MNTQMFLMKIVFAIFGIGVISANDDTPQVQIKQGTLKGSYRQAWKGKRFSVFTGIPYAKPPIGDLRFEPPVPAEPWKGILDATKPHAICPQIDVFLDKYIPEGNEDCLYLNVYTPPERNYENYTFPVMVYIHGGGWTSGHGNQQLYGPDYLLEEDVVLVVINYRLGAFGFLSTEDSVSPGNYGLKDQTLALKWVNENIIHFGGNPRKITLFGQSVGGASVGLHLLSPLSRGLFSNAIAQSGSALARWCVAKKGDMIRNSKKLAELLKCPTNSNRDMVNCLKHADAYDIVNQDLKFYVFHYDPIAPYMPVIEEESEGAFLTANPIDLIQAGKIANVPIMTGLTSEDGSIKSSALYKAPDRIKTLNKDFNKLLPSLLNYDEVDVSIAKSVRNFYFNDKNIDDNTKNELTKLFTDIYLLPSIENFVRILGKHTNQPVYYYLFGFRGSMSLSTIFGNSSYNYGVCHGDEFYYLLSSDIHKEFEITKREALMRNFMVTLWTNFAKFGNPTPKKTPSIAAIWNKATPKHGDYYDIKNTSDVKMDVNLFADRAKFWDNIWRKDFKKSEL